MRACYLILAIVSLSIVVEEQLTPEQAYEKLQLKLRERGVERVSASRPASTATRPSGLQAGRLLHDAWDSLMAHRYKQALTQFDKLVSADAVGAAALEGRGICRYELKQYKPADRDLTQVYATATRGGAHASRQRLIATAAASVMNANPMRAVKLIRAQLEATDEDSKLDEELQNDLGIALSHAEAQSRKLPFFQESLKYYLEYDKKLNEQNRDHKERWGTQWMEAQAAEKKWAAYKDASSAVEQAASNYDHSVLARKNAEDNYIELRGGLRLHSTAEYKKYTEEYKQAINNEHAAKEHLGQTIDHLNRVEKPPFPQRIEHEWQEPR